MTSEQFAEIVDRAATRIINPQCAKDLKFAFKNFAKKKENLTLKVLCKFWTTSGQQIVLVIRHGVI